MSNVRHTLNLFFTIAFYLVTPVLIGSLIAYFTRTNSWAYHTIIGFIAVVIGTKHLHTQLTENSFLSFENAMTFSGLIIAFGLILFTRGVVGFKLLSSNKYPRKIQMKKNEGEVDAKSKNTTKTKHFKAVIGFFLIGLSILFLLYPSYKFSYKLSIINPIVELLGSTSFSLISGTLGILFVYLAYKPNPAFKRDC